MLLKKSRNLEYIDLYHVFKGVMSKNILATETKMGTRHP